MAAAESTGPQPAPEQQPAGRKRLLVLVIVAIVVLAAIGTVLVLTSHGPQLVSLDHVTLSVVGGSTTVDQASTAAIRATAFDTKGSDVTANVSFTWSSTPAAAVVLTHPGLNSTAVVTAVQAGSVSITATAVWNGVSKSGSVSIAVNALHFYVFPSFAHPVPGNPIVLTVHVARADNSTDISFLGFVHFSSTDPAATLPPDTQITPTDAGVKTFTNVSITKIGAVQITGSNATYSITGTTTVYGNAVPVASFTATANPGNPSQTMLDASASSDTDGDSLAYSWAFGDGSTSTVGPVTSHLYGSAGTYTIGLTVYDTWLASNATTHPFTAHTAPVAEFAVKGERVNTTGTGIQVELNATASTGGDGIVTSYAWTFGDGQSTTAASAFTFHNYTKSTYDGRTVTVNLTVTNSFLFTNQTSRLVKVSSMALPPVAGFSMLINNYTRTVSVDGSASRSQTGAPIAWYNWSWGDGSPAYNASTPTASHAYAADGTYTITLTVIDTLNLKGAASAAVPVKLQDVAPVAIFTVSRHLMNATVNASQTFDLNGNLAWFTWAWGDGSPAQTYPSTQPGAVHRYVKPGLYVITLTANDTTNLKGTATRYVSVSNATLDYTYYDFFNVPYGDWWDMRTSIYGDLPTDVSCFNATSISEGLCTGTTSEVYPYTNWYPAPFGSLFYQQPGNDPLIYAPYRLGVLGQEVPGYNLSQPVFLPVMNYGQAPGKLLQFSWNMQYLTQTAKNSLTTQGCIAKSWHDDGFMIRSQIYLTLDPQEARRLFNLPTSANTPALIRSWFNDPINGTINPSCTTAGSLETNFQNALLNEGNGKYDIWNSFQYPYTAFYTNFSRAIVDPDGTIHLAIEMSAWGTEVLLAHWFYWGNASYQANVLDSRAAMGWWGMELAWFEDFHFNGDLDSFGMNFTLKAAMQYHFQTASFPGPDGCYRTQTGCTTPEVSPSDDVPYWTWGPVLSDYVAASRAHPTSELSRWTNLQYRHSTPGGTNYGQLGAYDFAPDSWPARSGEVWHFTFPAKMVFFNPATAPIPANPVNSLPYWNNLPLGVDYVEYNTTPANYGIYHNTLWTWDVYGNGAPSSWPAGWPQNRPGSYPTQPWGAIFFVPLGSRPKLATAALNMVALATQSGGSANLVSSGLEGIVSASPLPLWTSGALAAPAPIRRAFSRSAL